MFRDTGGEWKTLGSSGDVSLKQGQQSRLENKTPLASSPYLEDASPTGTDGLDLQIDWCDTAPKTDTNLRLIETHGRDDLEIEYEKTTELMVGHSFFEEGEKMLVEGDTQEKMARVKTAESDGEDYRLVLSKHIDPSFLSSATIKPWSRTFMMGDGTGALFDDGFGLSLGDQDLMYSQEDGTLRLRGLMNVEKGKVGGMTVDDNRLRSGPLVIGGDEDRIEFTDTQDLNGLIANSDFSGGLSNWTEEEAMEAERYGVAPASVSSGPYDMDRFSGRIYQLVDFSSVDESEVAIRVHYDAADAPDATIDVRLAGGRIKETIGRHKGSLKNAPNPIVVSPKLPPKRDDVRLEVGLEYDGRATRKPTITQVDASKSTASSYIDRNEIMLNGTRIYESGGNLVAESQDGTTNVLA